MTDQAISDLLDGALEDCDYREVATEQDFKDFAAGRGEAWQSFFGVVSFAGGVYLRSLLDGAPRIFERVGDGWEQL